MSAIEIKTEGKNVSIEYEPQSPENIERRLIQLKEALGVSWYGVAVIFDLKPTEASTRLFKRWARDPSMSSYQKMPESQWKVLLMLTSGQEKITNNES